MRPLQTDPLEPGQYVAPAIDAVATILLFLVVFLVLYYVGKAVVGGAVERSLEHRGVEPTLVGLAVSTTVVIVAVLSIALAATVAGFGVVLAAFATLAGALALAVGFAAQDLIANFVAGVFIIQDEPFAVGDWIEWDGNEGVVREIRLRVTVLDTFDNQRITVPNGDLADAALINNVENDERRVSLDFGIGYGDDIDAARTAIVEEGAAIEGVLDEPEPSAPVTALGDSAVVLNGRVWIDPTETGYGGVKASFLEAVKERFDAEGIDMPYPNTELSGAIEVTDTAAAGGRSAD